METLTIDQAVKAFKQAKRTALEDDLLRQIRSVPHMPEPAREFRFNAFRRWRFDFAWPNLRLPRYSGGWRLAVEVEGGRYARGRHVRPSGFHDDCEKYNQAQLEHWLILRFTDNHVRSGHALRKIQEAMEQ